MAGLFHALGYISGKAAIFSRRTVHSSNGVNEGHVLMSGSPNRNCCFMKLPIMAGQLVLLLFHARQEKTPVQKVSTTVGSLRPPDRTRTFVAAMFASTHLF